MEKYKQILNDMYKLLKQFINVPRKGTDDMGYWKRFSDALVDFALTYDNDPFAIECGCAVWRYCEKIGGYMNDIGDEIK